MIQSDHTTAAVDTQAVIEQLRINIQGHLITPDDADYDSARNVFYGANIRRPAVIVQPKNVHDIAAVVNVARETGIELAIRSGGHSLSGHSSTEGGVLLDLSSMKHLDIDVEKRTAWVESGMLAGEYTAEAGKHNLTTGFGDTSVVGIGGLTVGGGIGYLVRKFGLTIDQLLAAEVVTADGSILQVDANNHPDLFWALRGGGGNFGIVSRFQFQLHELPSIVGGMLIFEATPDLINDVISLAQAAPDELTIIANLMVAPPMPFLAEAYHGKLIMMLQMVYAGDTASGDQVIAPFRALKPLVDQVTTMAYPEIYKLNDMGGEAGPAQEVARSFFLDRFDREVAARIIEGIESTTALFAVTQLRVLGGAMARVPADATAFPHRTRPIMVAMGAIYEKEEDTPAQEVWINQHFAAVSEGSDKGVYVNFLGHDADTRLQEAYTDATWKRLKVIKAKYDPTNLFHNNNNIAPTADA